MVSEAVETAPVKAEFRTVMFKTVPLIMSFFCKGCEGLKDLMKLMVGRSTIEVTGPMSERVTPHSFAALANGWSKDDGREVGGILTGDWVLLTPLHEYPYNVEENDIVLAYVAYKDNAVTCSLKEYKGAPIDSHDPDFSAVDFGENVKFVEIWAVVRGKLRQEEMRGFR